MKREIEIRAWTLETKEKALELANKFYRGSISDKSKEEHLLELLEAKKYALIAVDEILSMKIVRKDDLTDEYWEEVKQEISTL
jgi:hypothetical protein